METQKLVTIVLVSTLLVVAIAIGISGLSKGGTGYGVRLLYNFVKNYVKSNKK